MEVSGRNTNHSGLFSVNSNRLADDVRVAAEFALPERISKNSQQLFARFFALTGKKEASNRRFDPKSREIIAGDGNIGDLPCAAVGAEATYAPRVSEKAREGIICFLKIEEVWVREI